MKLVILFTYISYFMHASFGTINDSMWWEFWKFWRKLGKLNTAKEKLYQMSRQRLYNCYLASTLVSLVFYADTYSSYTVYFVPPMFSEARSMAEPQNNWNSHCIGWYRCELFILGFRWEARFSLSCAFLFVYL